MIFPHLLCIGYDVLLWWYLWSPRWRGDSIIRVILIMGLFFLMDWLMESWESLDACVEYNFHSALVTWWVLCHIRKRLFLRYVVVFVSTIFGWPRWHWDIHRCGIQTLRCAFVALHNSHPLLIHEKNDLRVTSSLHAFGGNIMSFNYVKVVGSCH